MCAEWVYLRRAAFVEGVDSRVDRTLVLARACLFPGYVVRGMSGGTGSLRLRHARVQKNQ